MFEGVAGGQRVTGRGVEVGQRGYNIVSAVVDEKRQSVTYSTIRSSGHQVSTLQMTKTGLCAYDDKRYVLRDNVHTLAHGHWRTQQMSTAHAAPHIAEK